jgi:hypothetical protein
MVPGLLACGPPPSAAASTVAWALAGGPRSIRTFYHPVTKLCGRSVRDLANGPCESLKSSIQAFRTRPSMGLYNQEPPSCLHHGYAPGTESSRKRKNSEVPDLRHRRSCLWSGRESDAGKVVVTVRGGTLHVIMAFSGEAVLLCSTNCSPEQLGHHGSALHRGRSPTRLNYG